MTNYERYCLLRVLFIIGFSLRAVLYFVPSAYVAGFGTLSDFTAVRFILDHSYAYATFYQLAALFGIFEFCIDACFIGLALFWPKRLVFILGPCFVLFIKAVWFLMNTDSNNVTNFPLPKVLGYAAIASTCIGFWIHPDEPSSE